MFFFKEKQVLVFSLPEPGDPKEISFVVLRGYVAVISMDM
jgi:hypothetical protein